ncbi:bi-domain-containing oxidoreductase [Pirellulaceae bacterium]|nr:bi-domain-containing oxidoreductase [Pirellulaceae bacterium]
MEQLTQKLKKGAIEIKEVPIPIVSAGHLLVRNHFSLISAGTEGNTVKTARKSLIGKAKEKPQQVKQVLQALHTQGIVQTYRAVMKKLDAYSPLGYSTAGEVIEVGEGVEGFSVGDKVACAGSTANHAEYVCVPKNLSVKLDPDADLKKASFNTLGAIALQGIRQADLRLGESCAVIGLGLLGQLTCLMLKASGVQVFGIDVDQSAVDIAREHCSPTSWQRNDPALSSEIQRLTNGIGVDAVIITAGTSSLDPINFAGKISRKKGKVVVLGAVPTGFDREPNYYQKELEVRMSCSYGPGRYDLDYEEKGVDYPAAYVRWTEKRNMEAFQSLLLQDQLNIDYLATHEFPLAKAATAYDMIVNRSESFFGVLLHYDLEKPHDNSAIRNEAITASNGKPVDHVCISFVGAGSYAQSYLLPNLPKDTNAFKRCGVLTNSGTTSKRVSEKFNFKYCCGDVADLLKDDDTNVVFIATRHDSHAKYALSAIENGKHVFVEKPICLSLDELSEIVEAKRNRPEVQVMVGFNRRFAPLSKEIESRISSGSKSIIYRINAGSIKSGTWIQDPAIGGGRIIGEVCHFVDYLIWLAKSLPSKVQAVVVPDANSHNDTVSINIQFQNGSIGTVHYFANGSPALPKEKIEIFDSGQCFILDDFKQLQIAKSGKLRNKKRSTQDKGQFNSVSEFLFSIKDGKTAPIPFNEIVANHVACFAVLESLKNGATIELDMKGLLV